MRRTNERRTKRSSNGREICTTGPASSSGLPACVQGLAACKHYNWQRLASGSTVRCEWTGPVQQGFRMASGQGRGREGLAGESCRWRGRCNPYPRTPEQSRVMLDVVMGCESCDFACRYFLILILPEEERSWAGRRCKVRSCGAVPVKCWISWLL